MIFNEIPPPDVCRALRDLEGDLRFKVFLKWCDDALARSHEIFSSEKDTFILTKVAGGCYTISEMLERIREAGARIESQRKEV